jgi:hypothetical protein
MGIYIKILRDAGRDEVDVRIIGILIEGVETGGRT